MSQRDLMDEAVRRLADRQPAEEAVPFDQILYYMDRPDVPSGGWVTQIQHMDTDNHGIPPTSDFSWLTETE